jgi:MFS family permease
MAIFSLIVGKYQFYFGRRNILQWGFIITALPFLGFYLNDFTSNSTVFMSFFILMRIIQGIGTAMAQTATYAILTLTYPEQVNFNVGCIETSAGVGLALGPFLGTVLYQIGGGVSAPFLTFFAILGFLGMFIQKSVPEKADEINEEVNDYSSSGLTYTKLFSDRRIIFANLSVLLGIFQFAFIDPLLANYMNETFDIGYHISGYFFLALGIGYAMSCPAVHFTVKYVSNMRTTIISSFFLGIFTMMYADSNVLYFLSPSMVTLAIGLFLAGFANSHMIIPPMDEMINAGQEMVKFNIIIKYSYHLKTTQMP